MQQVDGPEAHPVPPDAAPAQLPRERRVPSFVQRILIGAAVGASLLVPVPAAGFELATGRATADAAPALAGDAVFWTRRAARDLEVMRSPLDGGPTTVTARRSPLPEFARVRASELAASAAGIALTAVSSEPGTPRGDTWLWSPGATARTFVPGGSGVDLDGPLAVFTYAGVRLADLNDPAEPRTLAPRGAFDARIAGRYVSWLTSRRRRPYGDTVVVFDRTTGSVVSRIRVRGRVHDHDIQADGRTVYTWQGGRGRTLVATTRRGGTRPRRLRLPVSVVLYRVRIARDRVAFLKVDDRPRSTAVGILRLGRGVARILDRGVVNGVDFDGRRLAWASRRPGGTVIRVSNVR